MDRSDVEAHRALNAARYADVDGRWTGPVYVCRLGVVTRATLKWPYVTTSHYRSLTTHLARRAWIVWRHGVPIMMHIEYLCGGTSKAAYLTKQRTKPMCPRCLLVQYPRDAAAALRGLHGAEAMDPPIPED